MRNNLVRCGHSLALASLILSGSAFAQVDERKPPLPDGYKLQYEQTMESPEAKGDFVFSDAAAWRMTTGEDRQGLELFQQSKYKPAHRSPVNIALIDGRQFKDFILDVDLRQTSREYGHRDMCLYFGFQDPTHFYYAHIATKTDPHAHNIFIVDDAPRTKISTTTTEGYDWGKETDWHKVRLVRKADSGEIAVYVRDMQKPIMTAVDKTFGAGWIGFGSFDDTGVIDDIRVYAPAVLNKKVGSFPPPAESK